MVPRERAFTHLRHIIDRHHGRRTQDAKRQVKFGAMMIDPLIGLHTVPYYGQGTCTVSGLLMVYPVYSDAGFGRR
jgi:hypothetical protein